MAACIAALINIIILLSYNSLTIAAFGLLYYSNWHGIFIYILLYFLLLLVLYSFELQPVMKRTQAGAIFIGLHVINSRVNEAVDSRILIQ